MAPYSRRRWWDLICSLFANRPRHVKIYFLLDQSGSMRFRAPTVVHGYNQFIQSQKDLHVEGETCDVSTFFFSDSMVMIHKDVPLGDVQPLTLGDYCPHGSTALRDATACLYQKILDRKDTVPTRSIVVILTDGCENASMRTSMADLERLRSRVATRAEILYLGSNQNVMMVGREMGAAPERSLSYQDENLLDAMDSAGRAVSRGRSGGGLGLRFTHLERARSVGMQQSPTPSTATVVY